MILLVPYYFISVCTAASITTNIEPEGNSFCPGEELILTCTSAGTLQRWNIQTEGGSPLVKLFYKGDEVGMPMTEQIFTFTLISTSTEQIVSKISTSTAYNTMFRCAGQSHPATVTMRIIG